MASSSEAPMPRALSLRAASRELGVGRSALSAAVSDGEIPGRRIGRRIVVIDDDVIAWIRAGAETIRPTAFVEELVARRLERETRGNGAPWNATPRLADQAGRERASVPCVAGAERCDPTEARDSAHT